MVIKSNVIVRRENKTIRKSIKIPDCLAEVGYVVTNIISSTTRQNLSKQNHHQTYEHGTQMLLGNLNH